MKVFVASPPSEGESEFVFTVAGELVHLPLVVCCSPDCGCERSMAGFASHKATTNFEVRDLPLEPEMYARLLFESLADGGWVDRASGSDLEWTNDWAKEHAELAAAFPDETPLTIERGRVAVRTVF